jgi:hypothetical protein
MSESYSDNQKEVDKIDIFVLENASIIALKIWAEDMPITSVTILHECLEHIKDTHFFTPLHLTSTFYRALFYGVIKQMTLDERNFRYPKHYFNRSEY